MKKTKTQRNHGAILIIFECVFSVCQWLDTGRCCALGQGCRYKLGDTPCRETSPGSWKYLLRAKGVGAIQAVGAL